MAKFASMLVLLCVLGVACVAAARPNAVGRQLLAATDDRFDFYKGQCKGQNVMVCKTCTATDLVNANPNGQKDGGFQIWCLDSGKITRQGDGGFDNWQFSGCFSRGGVQGTEVTFSPIKDNGTC